MGRGIRTTHMEITELAYLLFVGNKYFLSLLDHRLRLQLLVGELVFARVEQLSTRHTGQDQVCGIRLEINVHLDGIWVDRGGCITLASATICGAEKTKAWIPERSLQ